MPVLLKTKLNSLRDELSIRFSVLLDAMAPRELKNNSEGASKGHWVNPKAMNATTADTMHLHLAVEDFKNILTEIKKLK